MSNKIWVLTYTIGTNEGRKSRRLICDTKERAIRQQTVLGGELVEYLRKPEAFKVNWPEKMDVDEELENEKQSIAELESRTVTVKLPKPHAHLIWIQAGHAPDDYWDDVAVSHSEKDRCCDGSERYPVYARWEIEEMLTAAGIKVEAE
ncbi:hypothetical protein WJB48_005203 [Klebsiella pneumoniae]